MALRPFSPLLRPIMICGALYNLGVAMYDVMIAVFSVRTLHLSAFVLGLTLAAGGAACGLRSAMLTAAATASTCMIPLAVSSLRKKDSLVPAGRRSAPGGAGTA